MQCAPQRYTVLKGSALHVLPSSGLVPIQDLSTGHHSNICMTSM